MKIKGKIVAIGGGEIGRPGYRNETRRIDEEIIRLTGKKHPKLLFIPTASKDSKGYYDSISNYFGKKLQCKTDVLYLLKGKTRLKDIRKKALGSDIIYVGGGNTLRMIKAWKRKRFDYVLKEAYEKGIVLCGLSAGAICWFRYGNSDSMKYKDSRNPLIKVKGLDLFPMMVCPHYNFEKGRKPSLKKMIKAKGGIALALENCSAIEIIDDEYRIITSSKDANAYRLYKSGGKVIEERLPKDAKFRPLDSLNELLP